MYFDNIWAGKYCTFAKVADKDDAYVFGLNHYNQIGLSKTDLEYFPKKSSDFSKYKWENISGGQHHTLALSSDIGKVYALGSKEYGGLGLGKYKYNIFSIFVLHVVFYIIRRGLSRFTGIEVKGLSDKKIINIAWIILAKLYAWGTNGQLGMGEKVNYFEPTQVKDKQINGKKEVRASIGEQHTVILCVSDNNNKPKNKIILAKMHEHYF